MTRTHLLLGAAALALTPATAFADEHDRGSSGHLNIIYWQAPSTLNPYLSGGTKEVESASLILESLARFDDTGTMVPWLAADIPTVENGGVAEDLTSITWTLVDGVLWSDGTPLTPADLIFSWEYCTHPEGGCAQASYFDGVTSVEAVGDNRVRVNFEAATPFPYTAFVGSESPILQAAQFADCLGARAPECTEANFGPIGTGPFVVDQFRPNDVIELSANENFRFPDRPHFATVTFKGGGDATAAARAVLETGEFDYAWNLQIDPTILAEMEAQGNGTVVTAFGTSVERLHLNQLNPDPALGDIRSTAEAGPHPLLANPVIGQAMSMAIDRALLRSWRESWTVRPSTQAQRLNQLKAFFSHAAREGWIEESPAAGLRPPQSDSSPTMPLTQDEMRALLATIAVRATTAALTAERALVAALGADCQTPLGGVATVAGNDLVLQGVVASPDGARLVRRKARGPMADPAGLGAAVAAELLAAGAGPLLEEARARAVIDTAVGMADPRGTGGDGVGWGLGFGRYKNTAGYCAVVAAVDVDEDVRVARIWPAVDAGEVISHDGVANQIEGGILQAMSWTLKESLPVSEGRVIAETWQDYPILKFSEVPPVALHILDHPEEPPLGVGEAAAGPTAAALSNAVRHALGFRIPDLPLDRDMIARTLLGA